MFSLQDKKNNPFFSVIVPAYEHPGNLDSCLEALALLDYPRDLFEVIIVDDGSRTAPEKVVNPYKEQIDIRLFVQEHSGPATARNTGALQAKGEVLAFTDSDCSVDRGWLKALAEAFDRTPGAVIGGHTFNRLTGNIYSTASQLIIDYLYSYYNSDEDESRFLASNNLAVPAAMFRAVGGFDQSFRLAAAEDRELSERLLDNGYRLVYTPEAIVYHFHSLNMRSFCKQHFNYGLGACCFHKTRGGKGRKRRRPEPVMFYLNLLRYPFSRVRGLKIFPLVILMGISQIVNALGFFQMKFFPKKSG